MNIYELSIQTFIMIFFIYSFLGWLMEVIKTIIDIKKFINRGFLIGPYCPIYGFGSLMITLFLHEFIDNPFVLFIMALLICGILEYTTSFIMEKIYNARWWDYTNRKFNINGRICLETLIPFGFAGLLITYILNPFFLNKLTLIPEQTLNIISYILLGIFLVDNIISSTIIKAIRKVENTAFSPNDNTEEITRKVKDILFNKSILHRRLVLAYPKLKTIKSKIQEQTQKIKIKQDKIKQNISQKNENLKENIKNSFNDLKEKNTQILNEKKEKTRENTDTTSIRKDDNPDNKN